MGSTISELGFVLSALGPIASGMGFAVPALAFDMERKTAKPNHIQRMGSTISKLGFAVFALGSIVLDWAMLLGSGGAVVLRRKFGF